MDGATFRVSSREVTERKDLLYQNWSDILLLLYFHTGLVPSMKNMFDHGAVHNCTWYQDKGQ